MRQAGQEAWGEASASSVFQLTPYCSSLSFPLWRYSEWGSRSLGRVAVGGDWPVPPSGGLGRFWVDCSFWGVWALLTGWYPFSNGRYPRRVSPDCVDVVVFGRFLAIALFLWKAEKLDQIILVLSYDHSSRSIHGFLEFSIFIHTIYGFQINITFRRKR